MTRHLELSQAPKNLLLICLVQAGVYPWRYRHIFVMIWSEGGCRFWVQGSEGTGKYSNLYHKSNTWKIEEGQVTKDVSRAV